MNPRSIAIVGASQREDSIGFRVIRNLRKMEFDGPIIPVHPRFEEVAGLRCYPTLSDIDQPVDAAFIALPAAQGSAILDEAGRRGIKAAFINASGFSDAGEAGEALQEKLRATAQQHGIALCGPNNLGLINVHARKAMWTPRYASDLRPGPLALISQSGTMALMLCQDERGIGLSYAITTGNEAVLTAADYLAYVVSDDSVRTILLFLETIRDPAGFAKAAEEAERRGKRIVVLKSGSSDSGRSLVAAHTGALAGEDRFYDAYFRDLNVVRVRDPDELIETALLLTAHPRPPDRRSFMMVTLSGGEAALIADNASALGLPMPPLADATAQAIKPAFPDFAKPSNPLDAWGLGFAPDRFRLILQGLLSDPSIGAIGMSVVTSTTGGPDGQYGSDMAQACLDSAGTHDKKLVFVNATAGAGLNTAVKKLLDQAGIPFLSGMRTGLSAINYWLRPQPASRPAGLDDVASARLLATFVSLRGGVDEMQLAADAGVPVVPSQAVASVEQAVAAAAALGGAVVMKGNSPLLPHKTEHGLVHLGVTGPDAVRAAYGALSVALAKALKPGDAREIVVQKMAGRGVELIVGMRNDPALGSFVIVGPGGILVDVVSSASVRRGPVDADMADAMLDETVAGKLLRGVRGAAPVDRKAAAAAIVALSRLGAALHGTVASIEINPLIVTEAGAVAVDLLIEAVRPVSR